MNIRTLIILAMGPSRVECPYDTEVWALNNGYKQVRDTGGHLDKLFLAHTQVKDSDGNDIFNWEEINKLGVEVINTHRVKGLKSKLFPMKRIVRKFGCDYFSDTICYQLAYAIDSVTTRDKSGKISLRTPLHVKVYGADMHTEDEYDTEKGGIEYWVGYARGLGITVEIANGSLVCKTMSGRPYGARAKPLTLAEVAKRKYLEEFISTGGNRKVYTGQIPSHIIDRFKEVI